MLLEFEDDYCHDLYTKDKGAAKYPEGVVAAFFEVVVFIESAKDVRDLYAMKGFRVEKLRGKKWKRGERSLRLNDQFRLVFVNEKDSASPSILILGITDYHK